MVKVKPLCHLTPKINFRARAYSISNFADGTLLIVPSITFDVIGKKHILGLVLIYKCVTKTYIVAQFVSRSQMLH